MIHPGPTLPADVTQRATTPGPLENPIIWQCLLVAAVVAAVLLFRRRTPGGRPGQSVSSRLVVIGSLLVAASVFALNDYVGYVRTPHDLALLMERGSGWAATAGKDLAAVTAPTDTVIAHGRLAARTSGNLRVLQVPLPDPGRGVTTGVADVMLPPGYDADPKRRYPVVYLIHGYPGNAEDWFSAGDALDTMRNLLADGLVQPMIVVSPDMTAGTMTDWECLNVPGGPQLEDYLMRTVIPGIDRRFRTIPDRRHRALGGMSGGGYCTLNIGLHHVGAFGSLLITLPYDSLGESAVVLHGNRRVIALNTPQWFIPTMRFTQPVATIIVAGASDRGDMVTTYRIANALTRRGQYVAVHVEYGQAHTWREARAALPYLLDFASQRFGSSADHRVHDVRIAATVPPHAPTSPPRRRRTY